MVEVSSAHEQRRLEALARYAILDTLPEHAFDRLADLAAAVFGAPIALVNFVADEFTFSKACYGVDLTRHDRSLSFCARTIESDDVLIVEDLADDPRFSSFPMVTQAGGVRFYAGAPVKTHDGFNIGTVCVLDYAPRERVGERQRESLKHLAAMALSELELRRTTLELQREVSAKEGLVRTLRETQLVSDTLLGITNLAQLELAPAELVAYALKLLTRVVDVDWCGLAALHGDTASLETIKANAAAEAFTRAVASRVNRPSGVLWRVEAGAQPLFSSAYAREPDALPELVEADLQAVAWLPLGEFDGARYVVVLGRLHDARRWSERDRGLLSSATQAIRYALSVREQTRAAGEASRTDLLTGLANRRAFDEALRRAVEHDAPFAVAMLDVDGLKRVNDTRGHAAGDALLRVFASALAADLPEDVRAFRLGGDEFALLLPFDAASEAQDARAHALELVDPAVATARTAGFADAGVSFGVACWPRDDETLAGVVARADAALYEDKRARKAFRAEASAARGAPSDADTSDVVRLGDVVFDAASRRLRGEAGSAALSPKEADLFALFARAPSRVFSRADLARTAGITAGEASNTLDVHLSNVRRKLAGVTRRVAIRTVRGQGFALHVSRDD